MLHQTAQAGLGSNLMLFLEQVTMCCKCLSESKRLSKLMCTAGASLSTDKQLKQ